MANHYTLVNNFSTTLSAAITDVQTTISVASATGLAAPAFPANKKLLLTLVDPATPGTVEIVSVTGISGTDLTVVRGQEGTTAAAWASGVSVEARLTAGLLGGFLQGIDQTGDAISPDSMDIQSGRATSDRTASGSFSLAAGYNNKASGSNSMAAGSGSEATGMSALALGRNAKAQATNAIALGFNANASVQGSIAIGDNAGGEIASRSPTYTLSLGGSKPLPFDYAASVGFYEFVQLDEWYYWDDSGSEWNTLARSGKEITLWSPPIQLGDATWPGATQTVRHGQTIIENGYSWVAHSYNGHRATSTTGASEPTWTGKVPGDYVTDGDFDWYCVAPAHTFLLPSFARFTPTRIGAMALFSTPGGAVVYPQISAGPTGATTDWLAATTLDKLTGDHSNHFVEPTGTVGAKSFVVALATAGSDLDCSAYLTIKGYVMERDSA